MTRYRRVRLLSEPGEPWLASTAREQGEVLLNVDELGLTDVTRRDVREKIDLVGMAVLAYVREHPNADDAELGLVAARALAHAT